ncbi:hypothetical protein JCM5350_008267, partial [Sporobolomyces pararoseus]
MILPEYLELANLLISNYETVFPILSIETLTLLLPFLPLSVLIKLSQQQQVFGSTDDPEEIVEKLNELIDWQRDWLLSSFDSGGGCPEYLRERYLIDLFEEKELLDQMVEVLKVVPKGLEYLIKAPETTGQEEVEEKGIKGMCETVEGFKENLEKMSGGIFRNLDWNNVVLGGGAVLACLKNEHDSRDFATSDFDLFLYGLDPDQLIPKVNQIIQQISSALPPSSSKLLILKGFNATTLLPPLPDTNNPESPHRRAIQIVLQANPTVYDSIAGFDLDVCAIAFDGEKVRAVPGAIRALSSNVNYFDPKYARNFDTTASIVSSRTVKYKSRGFSLALPMQGFGPRTSTSL